MLVLCALLVLVGADRTDHGVAAALAWLLAAVIVAGAHGLAESAPGAGRLGSSAPWPRLALLPSSAYLLIGCLFLPASAAGAPLVVYRIARAQLEPRPRVRAAPGAQLFERLLALPAVVYLAVVASRAASLAVRSDWPAVVHLLAPLALAVVAALLALRTAQVQAVLADLHRVRDDLEEKVTALSVSRARLRRAQEVESRAAVLDERTRIAREIHDGVGHQLTRLLFQVRALEITHRQEPAVVKDLEAVGAGVGEALDAMRSSVHALADDAEDLATALHVLAGRSPVAEVSVTCEVGDKMPAEVSRCLVAVVREALTNAARHGRATQARVSVAEYPGFWRATVTNDGVPARPGGTAGAGRPSTGGVRPADAVGTADHLPDAAAAAEGMGLRVMRERVEALGGTLSVRRAPHFTVLVTIPRPGGPGAALAAARPDAPAPSATPKEPR